MTVRTVSNLPAAMHVETARCFFAIELSKQSWVIGFITPLSPHVEALLQGTSYIDEYCESLGYPLFGRMPIRRRPRTFKP